MATSVKSNTLNIETISSIRVVSSSKSNETIDQKKGLLFGGYGYSADVQANNGDGYSISIKVISKNGKYDISSKDLNVKKDGAKNITIGNFTFYDFYLISYSIDKEVENSILTLNYKDKSIFMDKVFIGLFNYHYGNSFDKKKQSDGIFNDITTAYFNYKCNNEANGIKQAYLTRFLNRVRTLNASDSIYKNNLSKFPSSLPEYLKSDAFFCNYEYTTTGVNGGYIILGREELNEENCSLPEVSYCFKDLTSALAYAKIPGIVDFNLGDQHEIYRILRRKYFGSLRNVLDQWGGDLGFKFYYQPKIDFYTKNYGTPDIAPKKEIVEEGIKLINLTSTSQTLINLKKIIDNKNVQSVIENLTESASLEGTRKTNVVTPIRREARTFSFSSSRILNKTAQPLALNFLPNFYGNSPSSLATIIGGTLSVYDPQLRDLFHLHNGNIAAMGISNIFDLTGNSSSYPLIIKNMDFKLLFASSVGGVSSTNLLANIDDYIIYLAIYDEARHNVIKEWEKAVMTEYYGKYYMTPSPNKSNTDCGGSYISSVSYSTNPPSESYIANELPFSNLLFGNFGDNTDSKQSQRFPASYGSKKYNPIFKVENPFDSNNQSQYDNFINSVSTFNLAKTINIINLSSDDNARMALHKCFDNSRYLNLRSFINNNNASLIVCKKIGKSAITGINWYADGHLGLSITNSSVRTRGASGEIITDPNCKTFCQQTLADQICGDQNKTGESSAADIGFITNSSSKVVISAAGSSCSLILPVLSDYRYSERVNNDNTVTFPGESYVLGNPPIYDEDPTVNNVMSYEVIDNAVPEILSQSVTPDGFQDQVLTFGPDGKNSTVLSAKDYHNKVSQNLNNSIPEAFEQKKLTLTSTYVPDLLSPYLFKSSILNSINFSFNESGFNTTLDFSSRPKQPKQKDSLFLTERFLRKL